MRSIQPGRVGRMLDADRRQDRNGDGIGDLVTLPQTPVSPRRCQYHQGSDESTDQGTQHACSNQFRGVARAGRGRGGLQDACLNRPVRQVPGLLDVVDIAVRHGASDSFGPARRLPLGSDPDDGLRLLSDLQLVLQLRQRHRRTDASQRIGEDGVAPRDHHLCTDHNALRRRSQHDPCVGGERWRANDSVPDAREQTDHGPQAHDDLVPPHQQQSLPEVERFLNHLASARASACLTSHSRRCTRSSRPRGNRSGPDHDATPCT